MAYLPQGMKVGRSTLGQLRTRGVTNPPGFTQTYATAGRTVPNATTSAVTETIAAVAPAGGTGATAGGWDTAGNRDLAITTINETKAMTLALKTQQAAIAAQVLALKGVATALIDAAQAAALAS
jgi:hypothetical protein